MVKTEIKIEGIDKLQKLLKKAEITNDELSSALNTGANLLLAETKQSVAGRRAEQTSVDTGRFLNSVKKKKISVDKVQVISDLDYAVHLEYGTSKISPRRHFRNTADRNRNRVVNIVKSKLVGGIK